MLPPPATQDWLIDALAGLCHGFGPDRLVTAPLVEATPAFFPDPWTPDPAGVERLANRLLRHAGLERYRVALEVDAAPDAHERVGSHLVQARHLGAPAWFTGIDRDRVRFGCLDSHFDDPETLVAHLCHEVAHAWRAHHRAEVADRDTEERLTDVTTVYLGFGLFTTNASYRFRATSNGIASGWSRSSSGYLHAVDFSFLLAAQAVARDLGWCARRRVAGQLESNQAGFFRQGCRALLRDAARLKWRLGLATTYDPGPARLPNRED